MLIEKPRIPVRQVLLYGIWPGFVKRILYRLKGYRIGKGVSIGFGSVIEGEDVEIGEGVSIGFFTIVRGQRIRLGPYVQIGSTTFLDTPQIEIGEGTKINEQVFVGGLQYPDSRLLVGRNCQIMQMTFINPARSITIGDDTGIGGHCLIFGHTSWLSQFEGYAVDFEPITIGSSVSLAWRVFVLPGAVIGDGAVVGADSLVRGTIPPRCLAVGFPARVVAKPPDFPKEVTAEEKAEMFRALVADMVGYFAASGLTVTQEAGGYRVAKGGRRSWRLAVSEDGVPAAAETADVFLSLAEIPGAVRQRLDGRGVMWIEVARKEQAKRSNDLGDEVSLFLKRYGVRTLRCAPLTEVPRDEAVRAAEEAAGRE